MVVCSRTEEIEFLYEHPRFMPFLRLSKVFFGFTTATVFCSRAADLVPVLVPA